MVRKEVMQNKGWSVAVTKDSQLPITGFKEWAIVCDSIARGETSLLIRKGGIAEGKEGFRFKHDRFFLFPTYFHGQILETRLSLDRDVVPQQNPVIISIFAQIEFTTWIFDLKQMEPLESLHVLRKSVVEQRFRYDEKEGLHIAFLRAFKLSTPWECPFQKSYGGCRSWVTLPECPSNLILKPVLSEIEQAHRRQIIASIAEQS
jgi:hypothetical protein